MAANPSKRLSSSIAVRYDIAGALVAAGLLPSLPTKRLRRMPHLFCRVLELPVRADSTVRIEETGTCFTFSVALPVPELVLPKDVRAEIIQIVPGVTKVCVAGADRAMAVLDELDIPLWRFRLPATSLPEASTAACSDDGVLILTVPKAPSSQPETLGEALPSLPDPHQVILETPHLDLCHGCSALLAGPVPELRLCSISSDAENASARVTESRSPSSCTDHVDVVRNGVCDSQKVLSPGVEKDWESSAITFQSNMHTGLALFARATALYLETGGDDERRLQTETSEDVKV